MEFLWQVMAFLLMITPLVFIHELGHFLFAKLFKVKVNTFSIFMGRKLVKKVWHGTEYCISAIPIGGYVSLLGEDPTQKLPPEEEKQALYAQHPFKRFIIIAAGSSFNILLTIAVYVFILSLGNPIPSNKIARVIPHSDAFKAGLKVNDRIIALNDRKIDNLKDYQEAISPLINTDVQIKIERENSVKQIHFKTTQKEGLDKFGKSINVGHIDGIEYNPLNTVIGISNYKSEASRIGMKTGDKIISVNGRQVELWADLEKEILGLSSTKSSQLDFIVERENAKIPFQFKLQAPVKDIKTDLGFESAELYVFELLPDYPAQKAGLLKNDRLLSILGKEIYSFKDFYHAVQDNAKQMDALTIAIIRNGEKKELNLVPKKTIEKNPIGEPTTHFYIGVKPYQNVHASPFMEIEKTYGFFDIINKAFERTYELGKLMFIGFGKLLTGSVSPKQLAGPLMIGKIAGDFLSIGFIFFLKLMALISLNLAFINLFPFPALDGGHILIMGIEAIVRRRIPPKAVATISYIGFFLLMSLLLAITFNDVLRIFF